MVKIFKVELSLLAWAMVFAAVGFYIMGRSANAAEAINSPTEILSRIHQTDLDEIRLGELAQTQSQSKDVKQLGDRMIKDHKANEKDVLALAKSQNITLRDPATLSAQDQSEQEANKATAAHLKTLQGPAFDKEYSKAMADGHRAT